MYKRQPKGYRDKLRLIADTGASISVLKDVAFDAHRTDVQTLKDLKLHSASGEMICDKTGHLYGEARSDLRKTKPILIPGIVRCEGLLKERPDIDGLWSLTTAINNGCTVTLAPEHKGGSYVTNSKTGERVKLLKEGKQLILELLLPKGPTPLPMEEKRQHNLKMHCTMGHPSHRRLSETYTRKLIDNFIYYP